MTEGLLDRYFRLLSGRLPAAEYGVIAEPTEAASPAPDAPAPDPGVPLLMLRRPCNSPRTPHSRLTTPA